MKRLWSWVGHIVTPLWKGAAKKILHSQTRDIRGRVKAMIDDDQSQSIVRVSAFFDARQEEIENKLRGLTWLPGSLEDKLADAVQDHGDALQDKLIKAIRERGPSAVDMVFDRIESELDAIIDRV